MTLWNPLLLCNIFFYGIFRMVRSIFSFALSAIFFLPLLRLFCSPLPLFLIFHRSLLMPQGRKITANQSDFCNAQRKKVRCFYVFLMRFITVRKMHATNCTRNESNDKCYECENENIALFSLARCFFVALFAPVARTISGIEQDRVSRLFSLCGSFVYAHWHYNIGCQSIPLALRTTFEIW